MKANILRVLGITLVFSASMARADDSVSAPASAQTPPDIFYDLTPEPKKDDLSFATGNSEPEDTCICLHKECYPIGEYIGCTCIIKICSGPLDPMPF